MIVTGGGSRVDVAEYVYTSAVEMLAKPRQVGYEAPRPRPVEELD